ncbi:MAG: hypothetical protein A2545_01210 [Planctomycetes bacterium RIFOXYD2_FULL_41_16]|nr:MAG: hypothetical protein A2545_01210 [Planctomycetes bacterium RIFOXYD2_FULL_41_16]
MIALDTAVLAIYHIFRNDQRYHATRELFDKLGNQTKAITIFNLLEFCGILATVARKEDSKRSFINTSLPKIQKYSFHDF